MFLPLLLVLVLTSLTCVTCQDDLRIRNEDEIFKEVCDKIEEIRFDFSRYIQMYKRFAEQFLEESPGSNDCREELNRMFEIIKCLIELADQMDKSKRLIFKDRAHFRQFLQDWLLTVQDKQTELFELADILRKKENVNDDDIIEFDNLNLNCINVIQGGMIDILANEVNFAVAQSQIGLVLQWNTPVQEICKKAKLMKLLCQNMMKTFRQLRVDLMESGLKGRWYPNQQMGLLCRCIIEFCRCVDDLIDLCKNANQMTAEELEKHVCEILIKIKGIRNRIVDYWEALTKIALKLAKKLGGADLKKIVKNILKDSGFFKLILSMDKCILKLECLYIDIVTGQTPIQRPQ